MITPQMICATDAKGLVINVLSVQIRPLLVAIRDADQSWIISECFWGYTLVSGKIRMLQGFIDMLLAYYLFARFLREICENALGVL